MKRVISALLALLLFLSAIPALGEEAAEEAAPEEIPYTFDELVVGNPTPMDGKFFTTMWGNATSDIDVRTLVSDYYLTVWGYDTGIFRKNNAVVSGLLMMDEENGDRTYEFVLYNDLHYSDGTPITAWDYAFSILFQVDPIIKELGGNPIVLPYIKGMQEYVSGEADTISGVRVLSDRVLTVTVLADYLPYFFELFRLGFLPYPIYEIAPGCKVYDDGNGVYIGNEDKGVRERQFTKELLEATVMDPEEGFLSHPTVSCGPYVLTGWDGVTCTFEINPWYKGNEEGYLPTIPKLRYTLAVNETMIEQLEAGEFHLLNKVTRGDSVLKGFLLSSGGGAFSLQNYPRIGLTFIVFTPDRPALQQQCVRQAIDYCLDKEITVQDYTSAYGVQMDGLIGLGQWMYQLALGNTDFPIEVPENPTAAQQQEYEETFAAWEALSLEGLKHYDLNVEEAVRLLEEGGWTLNEKGEPFVPGVDAVRYREIDGELVGLDLTCAYPETNLTATSMEQNFIPHLAEAGIRLTLIPLDMKTLLRSYNDKDIESIDLFYLGDDFNIEFDPSLFFQPDGLTMETRPKVDNLAWAHAEMYDMATEMCRTEPHDTLGFMQKWIAFQERLSDLLPMIPVYSNVYFDFYTSELHNYNIVKYITWGDAIVPSYMAPIEPPAEEGAEEGEEDEFGDEDFDDFGDDDFDF